MNPDLYAEVLGRPLTETEAMLMRIGWEVGSTSSRLKAADRLDMQREADALGEMAR